MNLLKRWHRWWKGHCPQCGGALVDSTIDRCVGSDGDARVVLTDLPVRRCSDTDHPRRWLHPDFGEYLIDQVYFSKNVPVARDRFFRGQRCFLCESALKPVRPRRSRLVGVVRIEGLPTFGIEIEAPAVTCPSCGVLQACSSRETMCELSEALAIALGDALLRRRGRSRRENEREPADSISPS